jgi:nucleoside phosphorylase
MSGVCAGNPEETALGDVVVGAPVYEWDEGKHSPAGFHGDHRQIPMDVRWLRAAQEFRSTGVSSYGEATEDEALLWFLEQLYREQEPRTHPALKRYFPPGTWKPRLDRLEADDFIVRDATGKPALTTAGSDRVQQRLYDDVDGPQHLPFRVLPAPMASGSSVISDPKQWADLKAMGVRKIAAIEMEAATIATIAQDRGLPWLVAKGRDGSRRHQKRRSLQAVRRPRLGAGDVRTARPTGDWRRRRSTRRDRTGRAAVRAGHAQPPGRHAD